MTSTQVGVVVLAECFVAGHAKTKGSMASLGQGRMVDKPGSILWRRLLVERLRADGIKRLIDVGPMTPFEGRVGVRVVSYMQTSTSGENWFERAKVWLISKLCGDVDKLARNVLDALSYSDDPKQADLCAGVILDDAQVVDLFSHKRLAGPGTMVGQQIQVWVIPEGAPW